MSLVVASNSEPAPHQLVSVVEVKKQLNKLAAVDDAELEGYIDAATEAIQFHTGPLLPTPRTERHDGGDVDIVLRRCPVLSITSVTEHSGSGAGLLVPERQPGDALDGYLLDPAIGQLDRMSASGWPLYWAPGRQNIVVVYTAGYADVPATVRLATLMLIEHLWRQSQHRPGARPQPGVAPADAASTAHALPWRVTELIAPYRRAPESG